MSKREERKRMEREALERNIEHPGAQAFMDRASADPYVKGCEITAYGMKVTFHGMSLSVANALLDAIDRLRADADKRRAEGAGKVRNDDR